MKRGFLNSAKAHKAALSPEVVGNAAPAKGTAKISSSDTNPTIMKAPHRALKNADKLCEYKGSESYGKSNIAALDGASLDHPATKTLWTTIPGRNFDIESHSAVERLDQWTEAIVDGATKAEIFNQPGFPLPIERPGPPVHRIAPAGPGKGLGVFATRDLKMGDLIIAERPLLVVPLAIPEVHGLPAHITLDQQILVRIVEWEKGLELLVSRMLPDRRDAFIKLANSHQEDGSGPILGRIRTNGIGVGGLRYQGKMGPEGHFSATCELISRVNHSCSPNARYGFNKPTFSACLRAVRDIKRGEEITITYAALSVPSAERQKQLAPYGFTCTCPACTGGQDADARRAMIPSSLSPALRRGSAEQLLDLIALIEREGLQYLPVYMDALKALTEKFLAQGAFSQCEVYMKKIKQCLPLATDGNE